ncbi:MAG: hypothetical protein ACP5VR_09085 [Acidimicrobiales bacterium]
MAYGLLTVLVRRARGRSGALVSVLVGAVLAVGLSACSTSPAAANVNGQVITEGQLSQELEWWASSPSYVKSYDEASYAAYEAQVAQGGQATWFRVQGDGSGPDNFGTVWVSQVLANMVQAVAIHQYLVRHHMAPTPAELAAAWAGEEAAQPQVWQQLPFQLRTVLADRDAEHALVEKSLSHAELSQVRKFYGSHPLDFWSQVCVRVADVPERGTAGAKRAAQLAAAPSQMPGGASYCMTPQGLVARSAAFRKEVGKLSPGQAGYLSRAYGYQVIMVTSRTPIAFSAAVAKVIYVALHGESQQASSADTPAYEDQPVISILKAAHVEVNPQFGTWVTLPASSYPGYPPVVLPVGLQLPSSQ